jgi:uncharacterized protein (DUF58 family)
MSRPHVATAAELSTLRDLEFVTRTTVEGLRHGLHRSPFHGYSAEFSQYRHYRPGDDLRHVDWKRFAKTDRFYTRQFRETTNLSALFVLDVSKSMDYGGKFALAQRVTAVLGTLVLDQGDAAGLLGIGDDVHYLPPRSGHRHLTLFVREIAARRPVGETPFAEALQRAGIVMTRRGLVIAVSDYYDAGILTALARLARMGHEVVAVQTLDADEIELPRLGAVEFVDAETGRKVVVQSETAATGYGERVRGWLSELDRDIRRQGFDYLRLSTRDDLERTLRRFLLSRSGGA